MIRREAAIGRMEEIKDLNSIDERGSSQASNSQASEEASESGKSDEAADNRELVQRHLSDAA